MLVHQAWSKEAVGKRERWRDQKKKQRRAMEHGNMGVIWTDGVSLPAQEAVASSVTRASLAAAKGLQVLECQSAYRLQGA